MADETPWRLSYTPTGADEKDTTTAPTWGDYASLLFKVGTPEAVAQAASGARAVGEHFDNTVEGGDPVGRAVGSMSKLLADELHNYANDSADKLSPSMQKSLAATVTSPEFMEHPFRAVASQSIRTLPTVGAGVAAGLVTPAGPWTALMVGSLTSGGLEAAQTVDQFYEITDKMTDKQLQDPEIGSKYYASLRESGVPEAEARSLMQDKMRGMRPAYIFAVGALTAALGPEGQILRGAKGLGHTGGILGRVGKSAGESFVAEGVQEGSQDVAQQSAELEQGLQKKYNPRQTFDSTAMGALIGAALGAPGGVFHGAEHGAAPEPTPTPTEEDNQGAPPPAGGGVPVVE